jgi:DNA invertase Pin-like site-specific DNA recombinase
VSTDGQDLQKNKADILHFANEHNFGKVHFVEETISGRVSWRLRLIAGLINASGPGDILIVSELSRLGRSMLEIMEILSIATERGLKIYALKGNWSLDGSLQSKIMAMAFAIAAEIERDLISMRTVESLAARRRAGQRLGRPPGPGKSKLDAHALKIQELLSDGMPVTAIARKFGTSAGNLHRWLKRHNIRK